MGIYYGRQRYGVVFAVWKIARRSVALRAALLAYGAWHDASNIRVPYTDVDYYVFTDAAERVAEGGSPYERATYRYSPALAYLLLPNVLCWREFGKVIFSVVDVAVGYLLYAIARDMKDASERRASIAAACWLLNPMAINVCTRGNADSIICWLVLLSARMLQKERLVASAAIYGIAVHFRIYPIIFAPTFLLILHRSPSLRGSRGASAILHQATFTAVSALTFGVLTGIFWIMYGHEFLHETYLYHIVSRLDPRHNFSIYFYALYIAPSAAWSLLFAVSQTTVQLSIAWRFAGDFIFCICLQTWAFVAFNKVCTAQYFLWYLSLLPCAAMSSSISLKGGLCASVAWLLAEVHWLSWAYRLEFEGENVFFQLWMASVAFFVVNVACIAFLIKSHAGCTRFVVHARIKRKGE